MTTDTSQRKLKDLRVADLKQELEKRNLDVSGTKPILAARLEEFLVASGLNPEEYVFGDGKTTDSVRSSGEPGDLLVRDDEELDFLDENANHNHKILSDTNSQHDAQHVIADDNGNHEDGDGKLNGDEPTNGNGDVETAAIGNSENDDRSLSHHDAVGLNETEEEKAQSRLLWISNLWSKVKANDLTEMFAKFGQTEVAKVIVSSRNRESPFGFVTMASCEIANQCVAEVNGKEFNGKVIQVEKVAKDPTAASSSVGGSSPDHRGGRLPASKRLGGRAHEDDRDSNPNMPERDLEYYKNKCKRQMDTIRDLEGQLERNFRRHKFQLSKERERSTKLENQYRRDLAAVRREREQVDKERVLVDKRSADLDRLEKLLLDRERMIKSNERSSGDDFSRRPAGSGGGGGHGGSRYYSNAPASASKRPYEGSGGRGADWDNSKRHSARAPDYPERGGSGSYQSRDRGSYNDRGENSATNGGGKKNWPEQRSAGSSSVAHWTKQTNHRPPFVQGSSSGADQSWPRSGGGSRF